MDIGDELKSLGYTKSHISLEWTSTPDDEVPEDYQLYTAEFVPADNKKPNIYILFRLMLSIVGKESFSNPWESIQIISLNQQPFNAAKNKPGLEDFGQELDIDDLYEKFYKDYFLK